MAAKALRPEEFMKLYTQAKNNLENKKVVEALKKRLNDKIAKDPKKAALVIEQWLNQKPKR